MRVEQGSTRRRIVDATIEAIRTRGVSGATARAIAQVGGFNQALIYYYFDDLNALLIAALEATSDQRMSRYLFELEGIDTLEDLVAVSARLFQEDVKAGTITITSELVSACHFRPGLKADVVRCMEPWAEFTNRLVERVVAGSPFKGTLPTGDLAWGLLAFYIGIEQFHHLDGDPARVERLFDMVAQLARVAAPFVDVAMEPA